MVQVRHLEKGLCALLLTAVFSLGLCGCGSQYRVYEAVNDSMAPLIKPGDHILADVSKQARTNLHDGDVILLRRDGNVIIKRVLALPGETIYGEHRKVYRDGALLTEPYLESVTGDEVSELDTFKQRVIPPSQVFVAGDNRDRSLDSRAAEYAPVTFTDVVGQYKTTLWHAKHSAQSAQ